MARVIVISYANRNPSPCRQPQLHHVQARERRGNGADVMANPFGSSLLEECGVKLDVRLLESWKVATRCASGTASSLPASMRLVHLQGPALIRGSATSGSRGRGLWQRAAPHAAHRSPRTHRQYCAASSASGGRGTHCSLARWDPKACHALRWTTSPLYARGRRRPQIAPSLDAVRERVR